MNVQLSSMGIWCSNGIGQEIILTCALEPMKLNFYEVRGREYCISAGNADGEKGILKEY